MFQLLRIVDQVGAHYAISCFREEVGPKWRRYPPTRQRTNDAMSADEHQEEAERLRKLAKDLQRQIIALQQAIADNPKVPKAEREYARERAQRCHPGARRDMATPLVP